MVGDNMKSITLQYPDEDYAYMICTLPESVVRVFVDTNSRYYNKNLNGELPYKVWGFDKDDKQHFAECKKEYIALQG